MRLTLTIFIRHFLGLVAIAGISCFSPTHASSVVKITALESPAWIQHDGLKSKLERNSEINTGDHVITGETGNVEMLLWSDVKLRLATNSDIGILTGKSDGVADPGKLKELYVHKGRACIYYNSQAGTGSKLNVNIGNALVAEILYQGYICVSRENGLSSVRLRYGSVQITHSVDPSIIVLSKSGTEFRIDDDGVYELFFSETDDSFKFENEDFLITETDDEIESAGVEAGIVDSDLTVTDKEKGNEQGPELIAKDETSPDIYTVYLFSTRSKDAAQQVNEKFQKAGYKTQIVSSETDSVIRYRIVVPGFRSLQAAKEFSESIVGKYGVSDTWIGRDKKEDSPITETGDEIENADVGAGIVDSDITVTDKEKGNEQRPELIAKDETSADIYTVYLFSTRSKDAAQQVNEKFQKADYKTQIVVSETDSVIRYRIVVSGFRSLQAAKEFSESIVGKYGVSDTWIGRDKKEDQGK